MKLDSRDPRIGALVHLQLTAHFEFNSESGGSDSESRLF